MADASITEKPKLASPVMGQSHIMSPLIQCPEHNTPLFLAFLPQMQLSKIKKPESTGDKPT